MTARIAAAPVFPSPPMPAPHKPDSPEHFRRVTVHLKVNGKPIEIMPPATVRERKDGK